MLALDCKAISESGRSCHHKAIDAVIHYINRTDWHSPNFMTPAMAFCWKVVSSCYTTMEDENLPERTQSVIKLLEVYQCYCEKMHETYPDGLQCIPAVAKGQPLVAKYFQWVCNIQQSIVHWKNYINIGDFDHHEIQSFSEKCHIFHKIACSALVDMVSPEIVTSTLKAFQELFGDVQSILVVCIPGKKW